MHLLQLILYQVMIIGVEIVQRTGIARSDNWRAAAGSFKQRIAPAFTTVQGDIAIPTRM